MPEVGRFGQVDPITETQENYSTYQYGWGNPVLRSDPNGDFPIIPAIPFIIEAAKDVIIAGASIYTAYKLEKELRKEKLDLPTTGASNNSSIPLWVQQRSKHMNNSEGIKKVEEKNSGKYSNLKEPKNIGEGKPFTKSQKKNILNENLKNNNGKLKSDKSGKELNPPKANIKGQPADMNQAEIDHKKPKSKGGSNSNSIAQVVSKEENLKKANKEQ